MDVRINWFWGLIGALGIFGYVFHDPAWYAFFAFFLFFLEPAVRKAKAQTREHSGVADSETDR